MTKPMLSGYAAGSTRSCRLPAAPQFGCCGLLPQPVIERYRGVVVEEYWPFWSLAGLYTAPAVTGYVTALDE